MKDELVDVDRIFKDTINDLQKDAMNNVEKSLENILLISENYLSKSSYKDLMVFYKLYFGDGKELQSKSEKMNKEVDKIIEQIENMSDMGKSSEEIKSDLDEKDESLDRVGLSYIQKKMESEIVMEEDLKEKLAPVLSSIRFAKETKERLQTVSLGLASFIEIFGPKYFEKIGATMQGLCENIKIDEEVDDFKKMVLDGE